MNTHTQKSETLRSAAIASGVSLLLMALAAGYSYGFVHDRLVLPSDAVATAANIGHSSVLFRTGIIGWLLILIGDVIAAWGLYRFFEPVSRSLSLLGAWMRLAYTALLGIAVSFLIFALLSAESTVSDDAQAAHSVMLSLRAFDLVWSAGLVVFGIHLLLIGRLMLRTVLAPRWIGVLLQLAAASYLFVHLCRIAVPDVPAWLHAVQSMLGVPMAAGELGLALWLLIRGGRTVGQAADSPDRTPADLKRSESSF